LDNDEIAAKSEVAIDACEFHPAIEQGDKMRRRIRAYAGGKRYSGQEREPLRMHGKEKVAFTHSERIVPRKVGAEQWTAAIVDSQPHMRSVARPRYRVL
jgi:hypothetical protein